jgi:large repetitive protein
VTGFSPTSGPTGTKVTISGISFTGASAVKFNGITAAYTVVSGSTITATVPVSATTGKISVTAPAGTVLSAISFTKT